MARSTTKSTEVMLEVTDTPCIPRFRVIRHNAVGTSPTENRRRGQPPHLHKRKALPSCLTVGIKQMLVAYDALDRSSIGTGIGIASGFS